MTRTIEILERLIAFDTVSANSNLGCIDYIEDFLAARGFSITRAPSPDGAKAGLFASLGPEGAGVVLSAHTDVVPVAGQPWTRDPFRLTGDGDRLYGRGTTDMKGFLATMLAAADRATGAPLREPLRLAISYDEEIGCVGIRNMLGAAAALGRPRACIVGEPTGMKVATGHKGKAAFRATCHGRAGHSALAPKFVNALHIAADLVTALRGLQSDLAANGARDEAYDVPYSTIHVGRLVGGAALNIVPETAEIDFEIRHLAADDAGDIFRRIDAEAERIAAPYRATDAAAGVTLVQVNAYPGLGAEEDAPVVVWARRMAGSDEPLKVPFGTEAGYFDGLGVPTIVCGPGDMAGQGHKADEYVTRDQLAACDRMMDRVIDDLS